LAQGRLTQGRQAAAVCGKNTKSEARDTKQIQMSKKQNSKQDGKLDSR
jgi:hypothetical protein